MRNALILLLMSAVLAGCGKKPETNLGKLAKVERTDAVVVDGRPYQAEADKTFLLLHFEGKKELKFEGTIEAPPYALVDSKGREYWYLGLPLTAQGNEFVSGKITGTISGNMTGREGRLVMANGTLTMAEPRAVLLYRIAKDATGLKLVEGAKQHPLE